MHFESFFSNPKFLGHSHIFYFLFLFHQTLLQNSKIDLWDGSKFGQLDIFWTEQKVLIPTEYPVYSNQAEMSRFQKKEHRLEAMNYRL